MDKLCKDCGKKIDPRSERCYSCSKKGKLNSFYGKKHTEENKIKAVQTRKNNNSYVVSEETRKKLSEAKKGHIVTEETRKKLSIVHKGKNFGLVGEKSSRWKGGRTKCSAGYILIHKPNHPNCSKDGYVREHILVMEIHLERYLIIGEVVHHENKNILDNRIENLKLFKNNSEHMKHHRPKGLTFQKKDSK